MATKTLARPNVRGSDNRDARPLDASQEHDEFMRNYLKTIPGHVIRFDGDGQPLKPKTMTEGEWEAFWLG
jgi:hypothetical protein